MAKLENKEKIKVKYPVWIWIIFSIIIIPQFVMNYIFATINLVIIFTCKERFEVWALDLKENPTKYFLFVLFFGLIAQGILYLRYNHKLKKRKA